MATYVPGVGSYLPDFKPFTPDYKFLSNVLDVKTQRYETNYKSLNDLYGKVVYGNLSRKDTQEMRDQYAENLAPKLQQISGMDLSMAQNVETAKALFKPFFEEDLIVKDLVQTKKYRDEMQYANMLKDSPVQEQRELYWQTGVQKMQYEMEDFVNAGQDQALKMGIPKYVPDSDLFQMAMNYLNESELGTDVITTISENGEWLIQRKNGDLITNEALTMVQKALKDDPRVIDAYHANAFVQSRQFADEGIQDGRFENVNQGQAAWATNKIAEIESEIEKRQALLRGEEVQLNQKNTAWQNAITQNGVIKGSPEEKMARETSSDLVAIQEKLKEINNLYNDQPYSERELKTTGEYNPEDTQSLLYRAYGLMMNYDMEKDLQAAALTYSKKDMMVKLEANPYAEMAKRHQYDMAKIKAQHENRMIEIAEEKGEVDATGQDKLAGLGERVILNELNTLTGLNESGVVEFDDYMKLEESSAKKYSDKLEASEIDWAIDMLQKVQSQSNNGSGKIKFTLNNKEYELTPKALRKEISNPEGGLKKEYQDAFDSEYLKLGNMVQNIDPKTMALGDGSPLLLNSENPLEEYNQISTEYDRLREMGLAFDHAMSRSYQIAQENIDKAIYTDFSIEEGTEFRDLIRKAKDAGLPSIIYQDENGFNRRYTKGEYKNVFANWAKENGSKISVEGVTTDGFDDTAWYLPSAFEKAYSTQEGRYAGLGESANQISEYGEVDDDGYSIPLPSYSGEFIFNKGRSDKQATAFYDAMIELNTLAATGKIQAAVDVEKLKNKYPNLAVTDFDMFKVFDINQAMRGVSEADMNPGEILNNPVYQVILDPLNVSDEAAEYIKLIDQSIGNGSAQAVILANTGFNEIQKNDSWYDADEDVMSASDDIAEEQLSLGKTVYNQYIQDLRKRRSTESKSLTDYPLATIKYFTSWTSDPKNLNSKYAGYTIQLSEDYISELRKEGGILEGKGDYGNIISVVIPKTEDINPRKFGDFNFSYVAAEMATTDDASFNKRVPAGGSFSITEDLNGQYNINYQILQFNSETGNFDSAMFTEKMVNDQDLPLGQGNRNEVDVYMRKYLYWLEQIGQTNVNSRNVWMKSNPDKVVKNPNYIFYDGVVGYPTSGLITKKIN
jgi:hypothetical protein